MKCKYGGTEMALRNKVTGVIHRIIDIRCEAGGIWSFKSLVNGRRYIYDSMDELKQRWEYPGMGRKMK